MRALAGLGRWELFDKARDELLRGERCGAARCQALRLVSDLAVAGAVERATRFAVEALGAPESCPAAQYRLAIAPLERRGALDGLRRTLEAGAIRYPGDPGIVGALARYCFGQNDVTRGELLLDGLLDAPDTTEAADPRPFADLRFHRAAQTWRSRPERARRDLARFLAASGPETARHRRAKQILAALRACESAPELADCLRERDAADGSGEPTPAERTATAAPGRDEVLALLRTREGGRFEPGPGWSMAEPDIRPDEIGLLFVHERGWRLPVELRRRTADSGAYASTATLDIHAVGTFPDPRSPERQLLQRLVSVLETNDPGTHLLAAGGSPPRPADAPTGPAALGTGEALVLWALLALLAVGVLALVRRTARDANDGPRS